MSLAAVELNVTQGAVSHQIRGLEKELGSELFVRSGGRLNLSPAGSSLLPTIQDSLQRIAGAVSRLDNGELEGELSVLVVPGFLSYWLLPRLEQFTLSFPRIKLRLGTIGYEASPHEADSDVLVRCGSGDWPNLSLRLITRFELFPVCSPALLHSNPIRTNAELGNHVLLHADNGVDWSNWLAAAGVPRDAISGEHFFSDARLAIEAAMYGNGLALGDTFTVQKALESGSLVAPLPTKVPAMSAFYLGHRAGAEDNPLAKCFSDWLLGQIEGPDL
jgi:LysR family glycine cleavage system transcriptional activator